MIITARFSSTCPKCGQFIDAGSKVEWSKGSRATHVKCPTATSTPKPKAVSTPKPAVKKSLPSVEAAPYVRGEKWDPCKRAALPDTTGEVRVAKATKRAWASLRDGAVGEPVTEGDALIVVGQIAYYESAEQNEDCGDMSGAGWIVTLYLRRATAEEAAPALAKVAEARAKKEAAALRQAQIKELERICAEGWTSSDDQARRPAGPSMTLETDSRGGARRIAVLSDDGLGVAVWDAGYYDDWRWTLHVSREPRAVELMAILFGATS